MCRAKREDNVPRFRREYLFRPIVSNGRTRVGHFAFRRGPNCRRSIRTKDSGILRKKRDQQSCTVVLCLERRDLCKG